MTTHKAKSMSWTCPICGTTEHSKPNEYDLTFGRRAYLLHSKCRPPLQLTLHELPKRRNMRR